MEKILITGATGFIGGFLTEEAVNKGFEVFVSVRKKSDISLIKHLPIKYIELNLSSISQMKDELKNIHLDYIIHNAGLTKAKTQNELNLVNAEYAENLAIAAINVLPNLKKYIYISSLASYGPAETKNADIVMDHHEPGPVTMYGISKLLAEKKLDAIKSLPYVILRPTAVYGPREKDLFTVFKMVNIGLGIYSGKGDQKLTFVYVTDLVEFILRSCTMKASRKSYFVRDGKTYSAKELNQTIAQNLNKKIIKFGLPLPILLLVAMISEGIGKISGKIPPLNLDKLNEIKASNWQCDVDTLINDTGHTPKVFLNEGVAKCVKWYKENKWI